MVLSAHTAFSIIQKNRELSKNLRKVWLQWRGIISTRLSTASNIPKRNSKHKRTLKGKEGGHGQESRN